MEPVLLTVGASLASAFVWYRSRDIALFYRPSCPYCRDFAATWSEFTSQPGVRALSVDTSATGPAAAISQYLWPAGLDAVQFPGVPTVVRLVNGSWVAYTGDRTVPALTAWYFGR